MGRVVGLIMGAIALALVAFVAVQMYPELVRYLKVETM
jgi:hypothetical protein